MNHQLMLFFDGNNINLDTAAFSLAMLSQGPGLDTNNLFLEAGYALYLAEEIDRAKGLGQSSDAWVLYFQEQGVLLPFADAWHISLPADPTDFYDVGRAVFELARRLLCRRTIPRAVGSRRRH